MQFLKSMRRLSRGIAFRYAVVVAVVLFGFAILYTSIQVYSQREASLLRLRTQATDRAGFLSAVIPESVYLRDFLNLETLMRQTSTEEAVVYTVVVDTDGRVLTRYLNSEDPFVAQALAQTNGNFAILDLIGMVRADPDVQEVRSPVISEGLLLGEVWLGYTTASLQRELVRTGQNTVGGALLAGLFLSLLTGILFNWQVRRPLQTVIDSSQALAAGHLESRVLITRRDELGNLGSAFNAMADRLQSTLDGLQVVNQSLLSSEARTRSILRTAAEGIITINETGAIESFNPAAARIFGYAPDEVVGQNVRILMPEPYHSQHDGYLDAYLTTGIKKVIGIGREVVGRRRDGTHFPISLSVSELNVGGQRLFTGIVSDISERKQMAAQMEVLARFPVESPNPILRIAMDGTMLFSNQASQPILTTWERDGQVCVPNDCLDTLGGAMARGTTTQMEKEIGGRIYLLTIAPVVDGGYVNLYAQDISERSHAQEVLAQERNLLRTFIDNLPDQVYVKDVQSRFVLNNPAVLRALGAQSDAEVTGKTDFDFYSPELAAEYFADEQRILTTGQPMFKKEEQIVGRDGQNYWLSTTKVPLFDQNGEVTGLVGVNHDITEAKRAADALRLAAEQNQLLAQAVEAVSDGIVITDPRQPDNSIVYANPAFCRITGYPIEELLRRNCRFLQGPQTDQQQLAQLRRAIAEKRSTTVTLLNYRKDGGRFLNELSISPVFSAEGTLTHFVGIQTDISERRKMADTLKAVLDTVGEGIVSADDSGTIVMMNPEVQRIFGYQTEEMLGKSLTMLMPVGYRDAHMAGMARYLSSGIPHVLGKRLELEGVRKNGQVFPLEIHIRETQFTDQHLFTASIQDITRRKEYDRMRDDFVSTVTHELRTPLASVMGWTETLLSSKPGPLTDPQKRFLGIIYESSGRLNRLIEEILTVSRIQQGTLQLNRKEFSPRETIAGVGEMLKSVAEPKGIEIDYQEHWPPNVRLPGDPDRIEQVLTNLIGNAIKFSPNGGTVTVDSRQEDGCWRVVVRDQGIGIPAAELSYLFERFYRASNTNETQIQGTGLGLYVCKAIVEGHGGTIGVESVQNEGTTVWFTVPL